MDILFAKTELEQKNTIFRHPSLQIEEMRVFVVRLCLRECVIGITAVYISIDISHYYSKYCIIHLHILYYN